MTTLKKKKNMLSAKLFANNHSIDLSFDLKTIQVIKCIFKLHPLLEIFYQSPPHRLPKI